MVRGVHILYMLSVVTCFFREQAVSIQTDMDIEAGKVIIGLGIFFVYIISLDYIFIVHLVMSCTYI